MKRRLKENKQSAIREEYNISYILNLYALCTLHVCFAFGSPHWSLFALKDKTGGVIYFIISSIGADKRQRQAGLIYMYQ